MLSKSRVIVITGANKGLGFELAKRLLKNPSKPIIVMTSRNETLGKEAFAKLSDQFPSSKESLYYHVLDITNKETYGPFLDWIKEKFGQIDVLVNNAAINGGLGELSPDYKVPHSDAVKIIGTNFLSTKEFTEFALPSLASDGKIINISTTFGTDEAPIKALYKRFTDPNFQSKDFEEICAAYLETAKKQNFAEAGMPPSAYKTSKALLSGWTYCFKDSLKGEQQVFSVCPGWCKTDLGTQYALQEPEEGTVTTEYLINQPYKANKETNGKFFQNSKLLQIF